MEIETFDSSARTAEFERQRGRLWGVAYRMLSSAAEADDMVQEAYLRWHGAALDDVRAPQAWLVTTVTRLCLDRLRQLRTERAAYVGPWLPEPLVAEAAPADELPELASDLSVAFLAVLERLAPEERAAFLLHDVFDAEYGEIAGVLGKNETACRQIVSRARRRVRTERPRVRVSRGARDRLLTAFMRAVQARDHAALLGLFAADTTWTSDGGGKAKAARKVVRGGERVARFIVGVLKPAGRSLALRKIVVNGESGLAMLVNGRLIAVLSVRTDDERIVAVYSILNPDKLRGVTVGRPH
jgi:RNA polymerase sigma-70 factor (ECF subfamily)